MVQRKTHMDILQVNMYPIQGYYINNNHTIQSSQDQTKTNGVLFDFIGKLA